MTYVDLNPTRAEMADTQEQSDFTSIQRRIKATTQRKKPEYLLPFVGNELNEQSKGLAFELKDSFCLVNDTGRLLRDVKRGAIQKSTSQMLEQLNILLGN